MDAKIVLGDQNGIGSEILPDGLSKSGRMSAAAFCGHRGFPFSKLHTLAEQVVALQVSFRSPVLLFKLPSCYALNPVMP